MDDLVGYINEGGTVQTRDGCGVVIDCTDAPGEWCIRGRLKKGDLPKRWLSNGRLAMCLDQPHDLIPVPAPGSAEESAREYEELASVCEDKVARRALHEAASLIRRQADELREMREGLERIACRHVTAAPLWWQAEARALLKETGS